jgi:hypothetical protein
MDATMNRATRRSISACVIGAMLTGCGAAGRTPAPMPAPQPPTTTRSGDSTMVDPALRALVDTAVSDLARRLGIEPATIAVLEARPVVWPDGSLGCPRPGMAYTQVQQDGARIRLRAQGREFNYHSGGSRPVFLCESAS